jgi:FemAB-related protein (PEP-CTERM system-associated)
MTELRIKLAEAEDRNKWDAYASQHREATPYHLFAWKDAVEEAYKHEGYYFIAEQDGAVKGILPLVHMRFPMIQNQLVALPFCDLGTVLADSPETEQVLLEKALALGRDLKVRYIEIRSRDNSRIYESLSFPYQYMTDKVSMLLDLPSSSKELWNNFKSKLRSQIRKSEKNGLQFALGDASSLDAFYTVFSRNMRDLGSPVHSSKWFQAVLHHFGKEARVGLVFKDDTPVGAGIILLAAQKVSIPWASTLREYNRFGPNMLLYWNFLKFAADNGYSIFDFGRSTPHEGTYKFKAQWGATPEPLTWHTILLKAEKTKQEQNGLSGKRELAEKIVQKMPLDLANFFGPIIRKYISL